MKSHVNVLRAITCVLSVSMFSVLLSSCKSTPAEKQLLIPPEQAKLMKNMEEQGFQKAWGEPGLIRQYDNVMVAVNISPKQIEESWWAKQNIRNLVTSKEEDVKDVAKYASESFIKAFRMGKSLKLVDKPGPKTLAIEFAIVQIIPNKPILGAMSNIGNLTSIGVLLSPIKLGIKGASNDTGGAIAMETIIRDSQTGKILGVVAERQKGQTAFFNTKEFTAYANIRRIIDTWTKNIVTALDQIKEGKKVNVKPDESWGVIH